MSESEKNIDIFEEWKKSIRTRHYALELSQDNAKLKRKIKDLPIQIRDNNVELHELEKYKKINEDFFQEMKKENRELWKIYSNLTIN